MTDARGAVRISVSHRGVLPLLRIQSRIVGAIILRDMRTRFGASFLSFSIAILWPMIHIGILLVIYLGTGRTPSYGTDMVKWIVSGAIPYALYYYPMRWIAFCLPQNEGLLTFPQVKAIDLIIARTALEIVTIVLAVFGIFVILGMLGDIIVPELPSTALQAMFASMYLGISMGVLAAPIIRFAPGLGIAVILLSLLMWMTGGILFLPDSLPQPYRGYLALNPFIHAAEWMRTGLYRDYTSETLNKSYLLEVSSAMLLVGLALNQFIRR